jgi:hypothetical protein
VLRPRKKRPTFNCLLCTNKKRPRSFRRSRPAVSFGGEPIRRPQTRASNSSRQFAQLCCIRHWTASLHRSQRDLRALVPKYWVLEQHDLVYGFSYQCGIQNGRSRHTIIFAQRVARAMPNRASDSESTYAWRADAEQELSHREVVTNSRYKTNRRPWSSIRRWYAPAGL